LSRLLLVTQGAPSGIGRVEVLIDRACHQLQRTRALQVETLRKRDAVGRPTFALTTLKRWLSHRPDIVVFAHVNLAPLGLVMRALRSKSRIAVLVYGDDVWNGLSPLRSLAIRSADAIWSISSYTQRALERDARVPQTRFRALPLSLTPEQWHHLKAGHPSDEPGTVDGTTILSVARLEPVNKLKGVDHVLLALPAIARKVPRVAYSVVGGGPDLPRLRALAQWLGIGDRVHFQGAVDDEALATAYRRCDVFALPSGQEGFGLVFIEAMAAGKAVVAADACATPEIVLANRTGRLVKYGDIPALADALSLLLNDEGLRRELGDQGRQVVEERFTFQRFMERFGGLLEELSGRVPGMASA
jgi:glycosyltransferase involved in cell wall biosynthesis